MANHDSMDWPDTPQPRFSALGHSRWLKAIDWAGQIIPLLPKMVVGLLIVVAGVLILWATIKATFSDSVIIDAISVPKSFEERGLTGSVISQRLLDEIHRLNQESKTRKQRTEFDGDRRDPLANVQLPETGLNVQTIVTIVRDLFGRAETRIGGELISTGPDSEMSLLVRTDHKRVRHAKPITGSDLDGLIKKAAVEVLRRIDPYVLAAYHSQLKNYDEMNETIDDILATDDDATRKWALNLRANHLFVEHDYNRAMELYDEAIKLDGDFAMTFSNKAFAALNTGDPAVALVALRRAYALEPKFYGTLFNWAALLHRIDELDEALDKVKQAIRLDPTRAGPRALLGAILTKLKDFEGAAAAYERAFEIEHSNLNRLTELGIALHRANKAGRADVHFNAALRRLPRADVYNAWGNVLLEMGDLNIARQRFRQALDASPRNVYAMTRMGRSWMKEGRVQPAEQACNDAIAVDERSRTAHIYCGDVFEFLKEHSKAVEHYRQALALNSADAATQAALGRHLYASGQAELGYEAFRRARDLSPGSKTIYVEWAAWLLAEQDYEGAHALYDQLIRLFPLNEEAHASKALLYRCQGRLSESDKSELTAKALRLRNETLASTQGRSAMSMMMQYSRLATPVPP